MIDCSKTENYLNEKARMTKLRKLPNGGYLCTLKCYDCDNNCVKCWAQSIG